MEINFKYKLINNINKKKRLSVFRQPLDKSV